MIFAAFNEESVIRQKIEASLKTDYPAGKLSLCIGSDASSDRTDGIIKELQKVFTTSNSSAFETRTGKAAIINDLVRQSEAELLLLTDANIIFNRATIPHLVQAMQNPKVGIAGGEINYAQVGQHGISRQEDLYLRWENQLKKIESTVFGCAMGVEGGCYLIRKGLFPGIPPRYYMEDFYVSLSVLKSGYQVRIAPHARCSEDVSTHSTEEYKRKVRISIGNFQNLRSFGKLILSRFFPLGFIFLSHKVLRWLTPFFLLTLMVCSTLLAPTGLFYALFAGLYMILIGLGLFGILFSQKRFAGNSKISRPFYLHELSIVRGVCNFH
ncbi:MAG: glycosyltransferase [Owenweeksia sp.]|nr:glycosyltransferase [Owenweeksia sp.]